MEQGPETRQFHTHARTNLLLALVLSLSVLLLPTSALAVSAPFERASPRFTYHSPLPNEAAAQASPVPTVTGPAVIQNVVLGTTFDSSADCNITDPLPAPVTFPAGTTQLAFQISFVYTQTQNVRAVIEGNYGGATTAVDCNKYVRDQN